MSKWPDKNDLFDPEVNGQMARVHMQEWYGVTQQMTSAQAYTELTIVDDKIKPASGAILLNSEGNAPVDNLVIIDPTEMQNGALLHLKAAYPDRKITLVHSSDLNGIQLAGGANRTLKHNRPTILRLDGNKWIEDSVTSDIATANEEGLVPGGAAPTKLLSGDASNPSKAAWKEISELVDDATIKYDASTNKLYAERASSADAVAGTDDTKLMTAKKTHEALVSVEGEVSEAIQIANNAVSAAQTAQTTANNGYGLNPVTVQNIDGEPTGSGTSFRYTGVFSIAKSGNVLSLVRERQKYTPTPNCNCTNCDCSKN